MRASIYLLRPIYALLRSIFTHSALPFGVLTLLLVVVARFIFRAAIDLRGT